ncbi:MAG: O-acetyl-ADP-ribose deacetylase [Leptospiraceae bacterium]|nr:O-acetyl-ADP-ribose deacetylase [Leptospiraceae bacterium]
MRIALFQGDITSIRADAIVNAANARLAGGSGVDGAIHRAGGPAIMQACDTIRQRSGGCAPGHAVVTTAGKLLARHVIHTVGPIYGRHGGRESDILADCYTHSLNLALEHRCRSVAFPNISTGIYGYPKIEAATVALQAVRQWIASHRSDTCSVTEIWFVCLEPQNHDIYKSMLEIMYS